MSRKSIIMALAAVVSLGTIALSSSDASAFGRGFGGGGGGMHTGGGVHVASARVGNVHNNFAFRRFVRVPPRWIPHRHWHVWRPYWIAPVIATGVATTYATAPTWNRCTCLTKEYTPQGAVVFKDVCTNEMAMNPPDNPAPAADTAPQLPQQGYLQPQAQPVQQR
jgi:hypothetical protein